jgi:hypothetical protein
VYANVECVSPENALPLLHQADRIHVRRFVTFSQQAMRERSTKKLLAGLPAAIATKLQMRPQWMGADGTPSQVMILGAAASDSMCTSLVMNLSCLSMPPQTVVRTGLKAYVLRCGCLCADGTLVTSSAKRICFGADDFFFEGADEKFKLRVTLLAVTHVELHYFGKKELDNLLIEFPLEAMMVQRRMRWARVFARVMWKARTIAGERGCSTGPFTAAGVATTEVVEVTAPSSPGTPCSSDVAAAVSDL